MDRTHLFFIRVYLYAYIFVLDTFIRLFGSSSTTRPLDISRTDFEHLPHHGYMLPVYFEHFLTELSEWHTSSQPRL